MHQIRQLPASLPAIVRARLRAFAWLGRLRTALVDVADLILATVGLVAVGCAFDRLVDVPGVWRLPLPILAGLIAMGLALRFVLRLCRRPDYDQLAHGLDQAAGDQRGHLRSLLDFARRGIPAAASTVQTLGLWQARSVGPCVDWRTMRRLWAVVALALVLAGCWHIEAVRADLLLRRFFDPLGNHMRPTATWLEVEPLPTTPLRAGDDLVIRAHLRGWAVANPIPLSRLSVADAPALVRPLQAGADGTWELPLRDVRQGFTVQLTLGAARSALYQVEVALRPLIEKINLSYQFPSYTRLPERKERLTGRTITALEGSKIRIELECNIPLRSALGLVDKEQRVFSIDPREPRKAWRYQVLAANERLDLRLLAGNGLDNDKELPLNFRVVTDTPPVVVITNDPGSRAFFPNEIITLAYKAQDDLGLSEVTLVAGLGAFSQEAELDKFGAKESAGMIRVPVSSLVQPGTSSVQVRITALDTKGQRAASPPVTIKIAANSYDRQLRTALRAFTATERAGGPQNAERMGFPALTRQAQKLKDLRSLNAKLTILQDVLPDGAQPGNGESKLIDETRGLIAGLGPVFPYLVPYVTPGHGGVRAIDLLGRAPMSVRLQRIVRDAACGSELAVSPEALATSLEAALRGGNPKAELAKLQGQLAATISRQEQVIQIVDRGYRCLQIELAGYLATTLDATLQQAGTAGLVDNDARGAALAKLKELSALISGSLADLAGQPALTSALQAVNEVDMLAKARPLLKPLVDRLAAASQPAPTFPIDEVLRAVAPAPGRDWVSTYALWLDIQCDDTDADEEELLRHALIQLRLAATGTLTLPAAPSARSFYLFATLARFAEQAASLRVALATRQAVIGQPTFEPSWLRLRELATELRQISSNGSSIGSSNASVQAFSAKLASLAGWLPSAEMADQLPFTLAVWEAQARELALALQPDARSQLAAAVAQATDWRDLIAAAIEGYRAAVSEHIADLEKSRKGDLTFQVMPAINGRLNVLSSAVLKLLDLGEAARLNGAVSDNLDLDQLIAVRVALHQVQQHLQEKVGAPINNVSSAALSREEVEKAGWKGKARTWGEHANLITGVRALLVPGSNPEEYLRQQVIMQHFAEERTGIVGALGRVVAPPVKPAALLAASGTDKLAAPAIWGDLTYACLALRQAVLAGDGADAPRRLAGLRTQINQVGPLPRDARSLAAIQERGLDSALADDAGRKRLVQELDGILDEIRPLAAAPPVFPEEERRQQQQLAVWQASLQRAAGAGDGGMGDDDRLRLGLAWALTDLEWNRRKHEAASRQVGIGGLATTSEDEFANLKLPKHLYLELKRAREGGMPELFRERSQRYLSTIMEKAR